MNNLGQEKKLLPFMGNMEMYVTIPLDHYRYLKESENYIDPIVFGVRVGALEEIIEELKREIEELNEKLR